MTSKEIKVIFPDDHTFAGRAESEIYYSNGEIICDYAEYRRKLAKKNKRLGDV